MLTVLAELQLCAVGGYGRKEVGDPEGTFGILAVA